MVTVAKMEFIKTWGIQKSFAIIDIPWWYSVSQHCGSEVSGSCPGSACWNVDLHRQVESLSNLGAGYVKIL